MLARPSARETPVVRGANYASRTPYVFLKVLKGAAMPKGCARDMKGSEERNPSHPP